MSGASGLVGSAIRRGLSARQLEGLQLVRPARAARNGHNSTGSTGNSHGAPETGRSLASRTFRTVAVSISGEVLWDPTANPSVAHPELLEGVTAAIHLSGANISAHKWTPEYKREIETSRIDTTRALATTLAGLRQPPQTLLVASATGFYGNRGDEILDESSSPGSGFLAELCRKWEAAAQPAVDAGIRVVYLRFGVVLGPIHGPSPGALDKMLPIFRFGLGGRLGAGAQWMGWISLDDVVSAVFFILENPAITGPVNFVSPNPITNAEFTRALGRRLHRPAIFPVPVPAIRMLLGDLADEALLSSQRALPRQLMDAGFQFAHPTIDEALGAALAKR